MITVERQLRAEPVRAWEVVSDVARWAELLPTVQKVTPRHAGARGGRGAEYALKQPGLPVLVYKVTTWEPGTGFTWVASSPGVRTVGTHEIIPTRDGCTLRLGLRWEGPLAGIVRVLYGRRTDRFVRQEADTFARLAEQTTA